MPLRHAVFLLLLSSLAEGSHWYTSPATGGLVKPPNYTPFVQMPGVWTGMLNHNPTFKRGTVVTCGNNDVVVREDIDGLENNGCIYLQGWAVDIADDENSDANNRLRFKMEVQNGLGSFAGIFAQRPCIDIEGPFGTCCPNPCGACGPGNLHARIRPHHFGQVVTKVTLMDEGQCDNRDDLVNACVPERCCESHPLEFHVTVIPVNDCPRYRFRGVDIPEDGVINSTSWLDPTNGRDPGDGGLILTYEDVEVCLPMLVEVAYGGWHEGPGETGSNTEPWHDQVLVWSVANDDTSVFKTQPHVRYVEGEDYALLCFLPGKDVTGEVNLTIHLEDTGGQVSDTIGGGTAPCTTSGTVGCYLRTPDESIKIVIREVNDPPTFAAGPSVVSAYEDSGPYKKIWARDMAVGPTDEIANGQILSHFEVDLLNENHKALFVTPPKMGLDGVLEFETRRNVHTYGFEVLCAVRLMDYPPPRLGLTPMYSVKPDKVFRIIIEPVNDPPYYEQLDPVSLVYWEDVGNVERQWAKPDLLCAGWDPIGRQCIANEGTGTWVVGNETYPGEGQEVSFTTVARDATLFDGGPNIDINGTLFFNSAADQYGETDITVLAVDNGGQQGDNKGPITYFDITFNPVNDPPAFDTETQHITVDEDSGTYSNARFLHNIVSGPSNEAKQTVTIVTSVANQILFDDVPSLTLDASGTAAELRFTPAPNAFGNASLSFYLQDDGGTEINGDDRADSRTIRIEIRPLNDPPAVTLGPHVIVQEDLSLGGYIQPNWVLKASPGLLEESTQHLVYNVSCDPAHVFATQPEISTTGTLSFVPKKDMHGSVLCTVVASDVLTGTGEVLSSTKPDYFQIGLQRVNDAPFFIPGGPVTVGECLTASQGCDHIIPGWARNITAGPSNENYQKLSFTVESNTRDVSRLFAEWPTIGIPSGTISFKLNPNEFAQPSFLMKVILKDDGGGTDDTYEAALVLEVTPSPKPPPPDVTLPVRLVVTQQPVSRTDGSIVPASFELLDGGNLAAPSSGVWVFSLVELVDNSIKGVKHTEVRSLVDTASATFSDLKKGGVGTYIVSTNMTVNNGPVLSAITEKFTVEGDVGKVSTKLGNNADFLTEMEVRRGGTTITLNIDPKGTGEWTASVVENAVVTDSNGNPLLSTATLPSAKQANIVIDPNQKFSVDRDTTLTLKIPRNAYYTPSPEMVFTFPVKASPTVKLTINSTDENTVRTTGIEVDLEIYGGTLKPDAAEKIWKTGVTPTKNGALETMYSKITSTYKKTDRAVTLRIGPSTEYNTNKADGFTVALQDIAGNIVGSNGADIEWDSGQTGIVTIYPSVDPPPPPKPTWETGWDVIAWISEIMAWATTILSGISMLTTMSLPPGVAVTYILVMVFPTTIQPGMEVRRQTQTLWKPFRFDKIGGNEQIGAVVLLLTANIVAGLFLFGASQKRFLKLKPLSSITALSVLIMPTLVYNAMSVVVYSGEGFDQDKAGTGSRLGIGAVASIWVAGVLFTALRNELATTFVMYKAEGETRGKWVNIATIASLSLLTPVADPLYGDKISGRMAMFLCLAVLGVRIAVTSTEKIYVSSVLSLLDTAATGFSAAGVLCLLAFSAIEGRLGDAGDSHWVTYMAAVFFILSLVFFCVFLVLTIKMALFPPAPPVAVVQPPLPIERNPIKETFPQQEYHTPEESEAPSSLLEVPSSSGVSVDVRD
eukprot:TRINITY_DN24183_c0_g1_i1.p1 TRINITY_DN24183_c0_g1~~TRINITY_DN24183_c0_g1_i1.p1  ORF type:complete len:1699 (+),score=290.26 TRINITY_DN24183_c0_g1_i1:95-5191(+)